MGRVFDREERRKEIEAAMKAVGAAIIRAITDAESSYDDSDAETLMSFWIWWDTQEIPETPEGKSKDA